MTFFNKYIYEESNMRWLKRYTDWTVKRLKDYDYSEAGAVEFLEEVKQEILKRFPDKEKQYSLIYERRFKRILAKKGIYLRLPSLDNEKNLD